MTNSSRMTNPSRYWKLVVIDYSDNSQEYLYKTPDNNIHLRNAQSFFHQEFPEFFEDSTQELSNRDHDFIQMSLWKISLNNSRSFQERILALLCLRCYVSHIILKTGRAIASRYEQVELQELLGFILQDDGTTRYILEGNQDTDEIDIQQISQSNIPSRVDAQRVPFSVRILQQYNTRHSNANLEYFTVLLTRQHYYFNEYLRSLGIIPRTDWSFLNTQGISKHMDLFLQPGDRLIKEAWEEVYRKDRHKNASQTRICESPNEEQLEDKSKSPNRTKCKPPNEEQLDRMIFWLEEQEMIIRGDEIPIEERETEEEIQESRRQKLMEQLVRIAGIIRQEEIYCKTKNIFDAISLEESINPYIDGGLHDLIPDENPSNSSDLELMFESEIRQRICEESINCLREKIREQINARIEQIKNSPKPEYRKFSSIYINVWALFYICNQTNEEISQMTNFNFNNRDQVQNLLKIRKFIEQIEIKTNKKMLRNFKHDPTLDISSNAEIANKVLEEIKNYTNKEIFAPAQARRQSGRNLQRHTGIFGKEITSELSEILGGQFVCP